MVPASLLEPVHEVLNKVLSEEDLTAAAGMEARVGSNQEEPYLIHDRGRSGWRARTMLAIGILFSPSVDVLRVFYVGR